MKSLLVIVVQEQYHRGNESVVTLILLCILRLLLLIFLPRMFNRKQLTSNKDDHWSVQLRTRRLTPDGRPDLAALNVSPEHCKWTFSLCRTHCVSTDVCHTDDNRWVSVNVRTGNVNNLVMVSYMSSIYLMSIHSHFCDLWRICIRTKSIYNAFSTKSNMLSLSFANT